MATFIVIVLSSIMVSAYVADCEHGHSLKKIDKKIRNLERHERHQEYLKTWKRRTRHDK